MTDNYETRLVKLAEELQEILKANWDNQKNNKVPVSDFKQQRVAMTVTAKINYLLGYILALKEVNQEGAIDEKGRRWVAKVGSKENS